MTDPIPIGERMAAAEAVLHGVRDDVVDIKAALKALTSERDQRRVYERLGQHIFEIGRMIAAAVLGALASGYFFVRCQGWFFCWLCCGGRQRMIWASKIPWNRCRNKGAG